MTTMTCYQGMFPGTDRPIPDTVFTLAMSSTECTKNVTMHREVKKSGKNTQNGKNITINTWYLVAQMAKLHIAVPGDGGSMK